MKKDLKLLNSQKTMTIQEVAKVLSVSYDTVRNCIVRIMPNRLQHGKTTMLTELEVAAISKELKSNKEVMSKVTVETVSTVQNTTTKLEAIANYRKATEELVKVLNDEIEQLHTKNDNLQTQLDTNKQYRTVKWMESYFNKKFDWRKLKKMSQKMGIEFHKVFDENYENGVNSYHIDIWRNVYGDEVADVIEEE